MSIIEGKLKELTGIVFNNWYALKIALDHGQGGPPAVQNGKVENLLNNIVSMTLALPQNGDHSDISDYLLDYMDDEFDILLEDDSQVHVTEEIYNFCQLLRAGNDTEVMSKLEKLPIKTSVLSRVVNKATLGQPQLEDSSDSDDDDDDDDKMEQDDPDPGWTVVTHKRK